MGATATRGNLTYPKESLVPEPMPQEWTDAYRYCSLDPLFVDKGDRRDAVKQYVKVVAMLDDSEKEEIYQSVKDYAADWVKIQQPNQRVEDFKGFVQERSPSSGGAVVYPRCPDRRNLPTQSAPSKAR